MTSIVFMGTPAFAAPILESLIKEQYQVLGVVTQPDRKVGRKHVLTASPVKEVAVAHDIPVFQPEKISGSPEMQQIIDLQPDLIVTAAFGQFLPTKLLKAAKIGAVNVHARCCLSIVVVRLFNIQLSTVSLKLELLSFTWLKRWMRAICWRSVRFQLKKTMTPGRCLIS
ncbi:hypothetical protein N574_0117620 [Lactiplantibacillus plantarum 2165]|nr:hypothetical protein N574_0117620 [Lactiplantibacillus plantarum 2165]